MPEERIAKLLAAAGVASRRGADALIAAGRVTLGGRVALLGDKVDPASAVISVDGRHVDIVGALGAPAIHLALHKPAGFTSTVADRHAEHTVLDLVPARYAAAGVRLYPVGRLDRESEGLLLLTNDGPWTQRVLHPRHGVEREYAAAFTAPLATEQRNMLAAGIVLEEGMARLGGLRPATRTETASLVRLLDPPPDRGLAWYRLTLVQGWRRQVRRMFGAVGAPVVRLVRVRMGPLRLDLAAGAVRPLTAAEVRRLGASTYHPDVAGRQGARGATTALQQPQPTGLRLRPMIALDGPGSSGKSSVGAAVAAALGLRFFDSGLLYRAVAWASLAHGVDPTDGPAVAALTPSVVVEAGAGGRLERVIVDGHDVSQVIRTPEVDRVVSAVARLPEVRAALLVRQRALAEAGGIVVAGRDIGTVVLPNADAKIWLDASTEVRAARRAEERGIDPASAAGRRILDDLLRRDGADGERAIAPARPADDAVHVRTDGNTLEQTVSAVLAAVMSRLAAGRGSSDG